LCFYLNKNDYFSHAETAGWSVGQVSLWGNGKRVSAAHIFHVVGPLLAFSSISLPLAFSLSAPRTQHVLVGNKPSESGGMQRDWKFPSMAGSVHRERFCFGRRSQSGVCVAHQKHVRGCAA